MNERDLLNKLQTTDFDDILKDLQNIQGIQTYSVYYNI